MTNDEIIEQIVDKIEKDTSSFFGDKLIGFGITEINGEPALMIMFHGNENDEILEIPAVISFNSKMPTILSSPNDTQMELFGENT